MDTSQFLVATRALKTSTCRLGFQEESSILTHSQGNPKRVVIIQQTTGHRQSVVTSDRPLDLLLGLRADSAELGP